jgi:hypothetical protein
VSDVTDACSSRMEDICEAMLWYYASNKKLPAKLEELKPMPGSAGGLEFTCPTSGQPYVYEAKPLAAEKVVYRLVLYEPKAVHGGKRWGIVMKPQTGNQEVLLQVIALDDKLLGVYQAGR